MMENVPVKIAERYKPPPQIRQHSVQLNLNKYKSNCYNESPEYQYDFQLERKVLATIPEWRRMRQLNIEARRERLEKRKQVIMREYEEKQKKLLGAVSYPSAEDLSSSSLDSGDDDNILKASERIQPHKLDDKTATKNIGTVTDKPSTNSFYNILQPIVLNKALLEPTRKYENPSAIIKQHVGNALSSIDISTFDYKDFEEDTSSPFDNIELKTINDLDILAQVLHNTQLKDSADTEYILNSKLNPRNDSSTTQDFKNLEEENSNEIVEISNNSDSNIQKAISGNAMISLENINFNHLNTLLDNENIPVAEIIPEPQNIVHHNQPNQTYSYVFDKQTNIPYSENDIYRHHNKYSNKDYIKTSNGNGYNEDSTNSQNYNNHVTSPSQDMNIRQSSTPTNNTTAHFNFSSFQRFESENGVKSKSVPDIIRELSQEVCKSEQRRTRNYSQNVDNDISSSSMEEKPVIQTNENEFLVLSPAKQKLVQNISSMGFSTERVTNLVRIIGTDAKKIIEHLILLTELLDLGFDESKISEALLKFENNKEKALEYLIS